jgi:hypothetical protein
MKFLYCPGCKQVQPRPWYASKRCTSCHGDAVVFKVKSSIIGYLATMTAIVSLILAGMYLYDYDTFMGENIVYAFLLFIILSFALMFVELGRAQKVAEEMVHDTLKRSRV